MERRPRDKEAEGNSEKQKMLFLTLKMQEGATSHGMQAASRSWKRQGRRFLLDPAEGMQPC